MNATYINCSINCIIIKDTRYGMLNVNKYNCIGSNSYKRFYKLTLRLNSLIDAANGVIPLLKLRSVQHTIHFLVN